MTSIADIRNHNAAIGSLSTSFHIEVYAIHYPFSCRHSSRVHITTRTRTSQEVRRSSCPQQLFPRAVWLLACWARLRMLAILFGYVASSHFAVILIPVSRDSKLWASLGIPLERALLYHRIAGHLAFPAVLLHALLFVIVWVWQKGWAHVLHRSTGLGDREHGGMNVPAGWMAFLCGIPMWITSAKYVRRRLYSLFKLAHWMFIAVLLFSAMHVSTYSDISSTGRQQYLYTYVSFYQETFTGTLVGTLLLFFIPALLHLLYT